MNGTIWVFVMVFIAQMWFHDVKISIVIGFAIAINMTATDVSGITIPLIVKNMNLDSALSASVVSTTIADIVGFILFLELASVLLF
ncbi:magnesium transporter [Psychrobacter frigidicola]|uniref:magnesium transporter n=1 Tax=Psychrobacter frigidicola TaxID=45611 RepID=UPI002234579C|nr:magnesium transporter [Psychrobacter frigidicola]